MREGGLDAVHVTIAYHEDFRQTVDRISQWNRLLDQYNDLIQPGRTADDGTGLGTAALKPRHRGAAAGGWLGRNPISMATHISLPVFKLTEKQTST